MPSARPDVLIAVVLAALLAEACSTAAAPDLVTEAIQIDGVDVLIAETSPPQISAHVTGVIGDGCATLHSVEQQRSGNTVTVTILRERPAQAVCTQIAKLYDDVIRLDGQFPAGSYLLRVNAFEKAFSIL